MICISSDSSDDDAEEEREPGLDTTAPDTGVALELPSCASELLTVFLPPGAVLDCKDSDFGGVCSEPVPQTTYNTLQVSKHGSKS